MPFRQRLRPMLVLMSCPCCRDDLGFLYKLRVDNGGSRSHMTHRTQKEYVYNDDIQYMHINETNREIRYVMICQCAAYLDFVSVSWILSPIRSDDGFNPKELLFAL